MPEVEIDLFAEKKVKAVLFIFSTALRSTFLLNDDSSQTNAEYNVVWY